MADIKKARIFLRRGTDASRLGTELCEGELGYSTDGTRVFVGDGSTLGGNSLGATVFILPATSGADPDTAVTTLTAASADGRAEVGDFAFIPASSYSLSTFNPHVSGDIEDVISTPAETFGTLYVLSARDSGDGALTWVVANSGIPISHIDIPDNSIAGDKIHGGNISGELTLSDHITALSAVTLSGVAASAAEVQYLTGSVIYPLGITATSQVTAVSSIYQLGAVTGSAFIGTTSDNSLYLRNNSNSANITTVSGPTNFNTGFPNFPSGFNSNEGISYYTGTINLTDVRAALGSSYNTLQWFEIGEFHFEFIYDNRETDSGFFGYYNEAANRNVPLEFDLRSNDKGSMDDRVTYNYHIIPNAYVSNEHLKILVGGNGPASIARLIGIKRR